MNDTLGPFDWAAMTSALLLLAGICAAAAAAIRIGLGRGLSYRLLKLTLYLMFGGVVVSQIAGTFRNVLAAASAQSDEPGLAVLRAMGLGLFHVALAEVLLLLSLKAVKMFEHPERTNAAWAYVHEAAAAVARYANRKAAASWPDVIADEPAGHAPRPGTPG